MTEGLLTDYEIRGEGKRDLNISATYHNGKPGEAIR